MSFFYADQLQKVKHSLFGKEHIWLEEKSDENIDRHTMYPSYRASNKESHFHINFFSRNALFLEKAEAMIQSLKR